MVHRSTINKIMSRTVKHYHRRNNDKKTSKEVKTGYTAQRVDKGESYNTVIPGMENLIFWSRNVAFQRITAFQSLVQAPSKPSDSYDVSEEHQDKASFPIRRIHNVSPRKENRYYHQILLHHINKAPSCNNMGTLHGSDCAEFK